MHTWDNPATWAILLVDDEIDNLEVVAETLEYFGVNVKTASDGSAALSLLETFSPTLVVTDLSMPGIDGWQLRGKIKRLPDKENMPILALSAHAMAGDKERALSAGFDGYLTKPINVPSLIEDLKAALHEQASKKAISVSPEISVGTDTGIPTENLSDSTPVTESLSTSSTEPPTEPVFSVEPVVAAALPAEPPTMPPMESPNTSIPPANLDVSKLTVAPPTVSVPPSGNGSKPVDQEKSRS